jgi:hypothetical protein
MAYGRIIFLSNKLLICKINEPEIPGMVFMRNTGNDIANIHGK